MSFDDAGSDFEIVAPFHGTEVIAETRNQHLFTQASLTAVAACAGLRMSVVSAIISINLISILNHVLHDGGQCHNAPATF